MWVSWGVIGQPTSASVDTTTEVVGEFGVAGNDYGTIYRIVLDLQD